MTFPTPASLRRPLPVLVLALVAAGLAAPGLAQAKRRPDPPKADAEEVPTDFAEEEDGADGGDEEEAAKPRKDAPKDDKPKEAAGKGKEKVSIGATAGGAPVKLVIVGASPDAARGLSLGAWSEATAERIATHELQPLADALDRKASEARAAKAEEGKKLFKTGKSAFEVDLEMSTAVEFYTRAFKAFEAAGFDGHWGDATSAWAHRVAARIGEGDEPAAKADLEGLIRVDPKRKLDKSLFPPDVLSLAKQAKEELKDKPAFSLGVSTTPGPARVWVDGVYAGVSPVELKSLPAGEHWITLRAPGYELTQKTVVVRAGAAETVAMKPSKDGAAYLDAYGRLVAALDGGDRDTPLREIGRLAGAKHAALTALLPDGQLLVYRVDVDDGRLLNLVQAPAPAGGDELRKAVDDAVAKVLSEDAAPEALAAASGGGWTKQHTTWTALGVGAAAVGAGAVFGFTALSAEDELATTAQTDPKVAELISSADNRALLADVLYGVGAVGLGVFTYLYFIDGRSAAPPPSDGPDADEVAPEKQPDPKPAEDDPFARRLPPELLPSWAASQPGSVLGGAGEVR